MNESITNHMSKSNKSEPVFTIEKLTASELKRLKQMVLGYGNFKVTAYNAGLHVETLRGVINRGHGSPESISKIRAVLTGEAKVA